MALVVAAASGLAARPFSVADSLARLASGIRVSGAPLAQAAESVTLSPAAIAASATPSRAPLPVSYVNNVKPTADKQVNAVIAGGNAWWNTGAGADGANPAASADHTLSYSFRTSSAGLGAMDGNGFQALSDAQKEVIRDALEYISTIANLTFTEDAGGGGQLQFGSNAQASSAAYAYYPNQGSQGGDVYLANNVASFTNAASWDKGGYQWETIVHEIGHALGLKHPGNYNAGGGGTPGPYLSKSLDHRTNSLMSYHHDEKTMHLVKSDGAGGLVSSHVNPDSFQVLDIAALQYLYGAAQTASASTYTFEDDDVFSRTIYDANAASRIDLSAMTRASVLDLRGGMRSSIGLRDAYADTGLTKEQYAAATSGGVKLSKLIGTPTYTGASNLGLARGSQIRTATGGSGDDTFISGAEIGGAASLDGGAGSDRFFIASGDAAVRDTGGAADAVYVVKKSGTAWTVSADRSTLVQTSTKTGATLSTVSLEGIETVGFWNGKTVKASGKPLFSPLAQPAGTRLDARA